MNAQLIAWITSSLLYATPLLFGSLGEILTEKTGHLNLGVPGLMFLGGFAGLASGYLYEQACYSAFVDPNPVLMIILPIIAGFLAGALGSLIYSFLVITLKANQNVSGLALTQFGVGVGALGGYYLMMTKNAGEPICAIDTAYTFKANLFDMLPASFKTTFLGGICEIVLSYSFLTYLAIALAIAFHYFYSKTRTGLHLRAVGENPATADSVGINVTRYKYISTIFGGGICGLGGVFYVIVYNIGTWSGTTNASIEALGWLVVALVIFSSWKPLNAIWGSIVFALLMWAPSYLPQLLGIKLSNSLRDIFEMLPYLVTIIVLVVYSLNKSRNNQPPASLGLNYFREER